MEPGQRLFSTFYNNVAEAPELGRFRRYTAYATSNLLYRSKEICRLEKECNVLIASKYPGFTCNDLDPRDVLAEDPELGGLMFDLVKLITEHRKDLCLAYSVAQLPDQSTVFANQLRDYDLFEDGCFCPTGENEAFYKQPNADTAAIKAMDRQDVLTGLIIGNIKNLRKCFVVLSFWRDKTQGVDQVRPAAAHDAENQLALEMIQESIELEKIRGMVNFVTGLWSPILFTLSMVIVSGMPSLEVQIAVVGLLGGLLNVSLQLLVQDLKRGELFSIIGGYFAVLGIFISANAGSVGH